MFCALADYSSYFLPKDSYCSQHYLIMSLIHFFILLLIFFILTLRFTKNTQSDFLHVYYTFKSGGCTSCHNRKTEEITLNDRKHP